MKAIINLYFRLFNFWMRFPEKIRFILVGGYNAVISYLLYVLILWFTNEKSPQLALFTSFIVSTFHNFLTQKIYVFCTKGGYLREYIKCLTSWTISYVLNSMFLILFTAVFNINPYLAEFFAMAIVGVNTYLMLKFFAFKNKH